MKHLSLILQLVGSRCNFCFWFTTNLQKGGMEWDGKSIGTGCACPAREIHR